jgi:hypothetical protein
VRFFFNSDFQEDAIASGYRLRRLVKNTDGLPENVNLLQHLNRVSRIDEVSMQDGKKPRPVTLVLYTLSFRSILLSSMDS